MNDQYTYEKREEAKDRLKSGAITAAVWAALLIFLFLYKIVERIPEKQEVETRMLINFGDNRNGKGAEEPANQEGSLAAQANPAPEETPSEPVAKIEKSEPKPVAKPQKETPTEKIITGTNDKKSVKTSDDSKKATEKSSKTESAKSSASKKSGSTAATANSKTGNGDGKGTAAIGNLIRGRGTKAGSQGDGTGVGNYGDPLGGDGDGDSKIGVDRRLTRYIPGTMGRGGAQPSHSCTASGSITIAYTVDKAGNVVSARRNGGISDPCVVSTSVGWVKKYVKAERANSSSTGTYRITF